MFGGNEVTVDLMIFGLFVFIVFVIVTIAFMFCNLYASMNVETQIMDLSESDIFYDEHDFYVFDPDGNKITLGVDSGEILDLTKHSKVLVKFKKEPSVFLYPGTGWYVDGVVKTPEP